MVMHDTSNTWSSLRIYFVSVHHTKSPSSSASFSSVFSGNRSSPTAPIVEARALDWATLRSTSPFAGVGYEFVYGADLLDNLAAQHRGADNPPLDAVFAAAERSSCSGRLSWASNPSRESGSPSRRSGGAAGAGGPTPTEQRVGGGRSGLTLVLAQSRPCSWVAKNYLQVGRERGFMEFC